VQLYTNQVDRRASIQIYGGSQRKPVDVTVELPPRWWWTDLRFRQSDATRASISRTAR
jgi:hypothetical protein